MGRQQRREHGVAQHNELGRGERFMMLADESELGDPVDDST